MTDDLTHNVKAFFEGKVRAHGATPQGLDYSNAQRQQISFAQLVKVWEDPAQAYRLLDYGAGYGALLDYLDERGYTLRDYVGYDIAPGMVEAGQARYADRPHCRFTAQADDLQPADYVIAGGVFNMKLDARNAAWLAYLLQQVEMLWPLAERGLAFNLLTQYSDFDRMRPDLYYADPSFWFDYCKQRLSRKVALLHDYEAYEFTILVRR